MTTDGKIPGAADAKLGKPKAPPPPTMTRLAADAEVESIDGPVAIGGMVGKFVPVLTRLADGQLGFRMMREVREVEATGRILRVVDAGGRAVRVGVGEGRWVGQAAQHLEPFGKSADLLIQAANFVVTRRA